YYDRGATPNDNLPSKSALKLTQFGGLPPISEPNTPSSAGGDRVALLHGSGDCHPRPPLISAQRRPPARIAAGGSGLRRERRRFFVGHVPARVMQKTERTQPLDLA